MYDRSSTKQKWTFMKYMRDFEQIIKYASAIRNYSSNISDYTLGKIQEEFECKGIYNPRFGKRNLTTIECKTRQIVYFMFGYTKKINNKLKMVFSPLGNLLLDYQDNKEFVSKIFFTMLFSIEFKHPFNKMSDDFEVRPFRIIFKLLCDERLEGRLYNDEVFYYVSFLKKIDSNIYEKLIKDILSFRKLDCKEKFKLFKKDEEVLADSLHLWRYVCGTLEGAGILKNFKTDDKKYGNLNQGKSTHRSYRYEYVKLNEDIVKFAKKMLLKYMYDEPVLMKNNELMRTDIITQMYNFYPEELISELGIMNENQEELLSILNITNKIEEYGKNINNATCYKFEDILTEAFNSFIDVRAESIGGAGNTDIECKYFHDNTYTKFDIEAKSTNNKLNLINAGRLKRHRNLIGSQYTIVITPDYVPSVKYDIVGSEIVILKTRTLSNFLYQLSVKYNRNISYKILNKIIVNNLGKDITECVDMYICEHLSSEIGECLLHNN